jgi:hypothetical protein
MAARTPKNWENPKSGYRGILDLDNAILDLNKSESGYLITDENTVSPPLTVELPEADEMGLRYGIHATGANAYIRVVPFAGDVVNCVGGPTEGAGLHLPSPVATFMEIECTEIGIWTVKGGAGYLVFDSSDDVYPLAGNPPNEAGIPFGFWEAAPGDTVPSFDSVSRVLTLNVGSSAAFFDKNRVVSVGSNQVWAAIPDVSDLYYFTLDPVGGQLRVDTAGWPYGVPVCTVYYDATLNVGYIGWALPPVSTKQDWELQEASDPLIQQREAPYHVQSFKLSGYTLDSDIDADMYLDMFLGGRFRFSTNIVRVVHDLAPSAPWEQPLQTPAQIPVLRNNGGLWIKEAATNWPFRNTGTGRVAYTDHAAETELPDGDYTLYLIAAVNDPESPIVSIQTNFNGSLEKVRNVDPKYIDGWDTAPYSHMVPLYGVVIQSDDTYTGGTKRAMYREIMDYRNWALGAGDLKHSGLTFLREDDHPQYAFRDLVFVPHSGSDYVASEDDNGKLITLTSSHHVVLPEDPTPGIRIGMGLGTLGVTAGVKTQGSDVVVIPKQNPGTTSSVQWESSTYGSYAWFIYGGSNYWIQQDGNGEWFDNAAPAQKRYNWDGNNYASKLGDLMRSDLAGNIQNAEFMVADILVFDMISDVGQSGADPSPTQVGEAWVCNDWLSYPDGTIVVCTDTVTPTWQIVGNLTGPAFRYIVVRGSGTGAAPAGSFAGKQSKVMAYVDGVGWQDFGAGSNAGIFPIKNDDPVYGNRLAVWEDGGGWSLHHPAVESILQTDTSTTLTEADNGKLVVSNPGGSNPVIFTLPDAPSIGVAYSFACLEATEVQCSGSDAIAGPGGFGSTIKTVATSGALPTLRLVYLGANMWLGDRAGGLWEYSGAGTDYYQGDGKLASADAGKIVVVGSQGNIEANGTDTTISDLLPELENVYTTGQGSVGVSTSMSGWVILDNSSVSLSETQVGLPDGPDVGFHIHIIVRSGNTKVTPNTGDTIKMPWGDVTATDSIKTDHPGRITLVWTAADTWDVQHATGMWYDDSDETLWHAFDGEAGERQVDVTDDATTNIDLGATATYRAFFLDYILDDNANSATEAGTIMVMWFGASTTENSDRTGMPTGPISGITFNSDINSGNVRLNIVAASVGSDLKFRYRLRRVEMVA